MIKIRILTRLVAAYLFGLASIASFAVPRESSIIACPEVTQLSESIIEIPQATEHFNAFTAAELTPDSFVNVPGAPGWYKPKGDLADIFEDLTYFANKAEVYSGIRSGFFYAPEHSNPHAKPIVIVVVHGTGFNAFGFKTGGSATVDYFDPSTEAFKGILHFARSEADKAQAPVQVVSFQWSGANVSEKRKDPGAVLAHVLKRYSNFKIITLSHSHGGNIVNIASNQPGVPVIDTMIQIATPVRDVKFEGGLYAPKNFKTLFQFWSSDDFVVLGGAISSWADVFAGEIFKRSTRKYMPFLDPTSPLYTHTTYNPFVTPPEGVVYNIRSQVDGKFVGHSWIDALTPVLIPVLHDVRLYKANTDIDLDIETYTHETIAAIRRPLEQTLYYKDFLKPLADKSPAFKKALYNEADLEKKYSAMQKARYFTLYKTNMSETDPALRRAVRKLESLARVVSGYFSKN